MADKIVKNYKCRGCGAIVTDDNVNLSYATKWALHEMFKEADAFLGHATAESPLSGGSDYLLHPCANQKIGVCDFIGWELKEDAPYDGDRKA